MSIYANYLTHKKHPFNSKSYTALTACHCGLKWIKSRYTMINSPIKSLVQAILKQILLINSRMVSIKKTTTLSDNITGLEQRNLSQSLFVLMMISLFLLYLNSDPFFCLQPEMMG